MPKSQKLRWMNRYSTSIIKVALYLKQFMKLFHLAHPLSTLSKSKTLYMFFLILYGQKLPNSRDVYQLLIPKYHIQGIAFFERLITHILKGKMNLLWKKLKPQK